MAAPYDLNDDSVVVIIGSGAGGGTLGNELAQKGIDVVILEAGGRIEYEEFINDEWDSFSQLAWLDNRTTGGGWRVSKDFPNLPAWIVKAVGGTTTHWAGASLRIQEHEFKTLTHYGKVEGANLLDWPISYADLAPYYDEVEQALKVSGPVRYPWGPKHRRYPYREHPVNAAGLVLARGAEKLGIEWAPVPLATVSAPRGRSPPCVYRGFCNFGCSTNAKQSALIVWIPRALKAGAEVRDMAMVGRIETDVRGRATGVHYRREGEWRFQKARHVVVAGYSIETPRLLLASGIANSSGYVGKCLMTHSGPGVWATFDEAIRWYKGPPNMAVTEHWNYADAGKDFPGHYAFMSQGPLPRAWAQILVGARGLWGPALREEMLKYNHMAGFVPVGETEPQETNRVDLAEDVDQHGLRIPRATFAYSDNDRRLIEHSKRKMGEMLEAAGGRDLWTSDDTSHLLGGCRMGDDPKNSVVDADGRCWDVPNLWVCDGSLFPTSGGVNPSLTIQALACRIGDRIKALATRGKL